MNWSGQLQQINGEGVISTTWLLTIETKPKSNWSSTYVGQDIFKRNRPTEENIELALKLKPGSPPIYLFD